MIEPLAGFAQHLRSLREAQGLSVRALADMVGVSSVTIWKWERGDSRPRPHLLLPLARALDVTPMELSAPRLSGEAGDNGGLQLEAQAADRATPALGDGATIAPGDTLADVIAKAKQMISEASGTGTNNITILIEY